MAYFVLQYGKRIEFTGKAWMGQLGLPCLVGLSFRREGGRGL